jgi:hypothetical protein
MTEDRLMSALSAAAGNVFPAVKKVSGNGFIGGSRYQIIIRACRATKLLATIRPSRSI